VQHPVSATTGLTGFFIFLGLQPNSKNLWSLIDCHAATFGNLIASVERHSPRHHGTLLHWAIEKAIIKADLLQGGRRG
jgi:hypothetical protein